MTQVELDPAEIIQALGLLPHPEGGHYVETYRTSLEADAPAHARAHATAIYFLLRAGERSHWHRVDADEIWHHYAGAALELSVAVPGQAPSVAILGSDLTAGERPQRVVPAGHWQAARSLGAWTLVGCTVSPAFEFAGFELAPPDFEPASVSDRR
jgi:predicted cupin superfamily sugar epimerase